METYHFISEEIKQRQEEEEIARKAEQEEEAKRAAELAMVNRERVDYRAVRYDMKIEDREVRSPRTDVKTIASIIATSLCLTGLTFPQAPRASVVDVPQRKVLDMQHQEDERERRLEQLRAQVAVEAKRDPQRLLQPTAASIAEDPGTTSIFDNGHGYSDDHLFRDQRFKVRWGIGSMGGFQPAPHSALSPGPVPCDLGT